MLKQQSIIITIGILISLAFAQIDLDEGTLSIKLGLNNFYGILLTIIVIVIRQLKFKQKVRHLSIDSPQKASETTDWEDIPKIGQPILRKESFQDSICSELNHQQSTQSQKDLEGSESSFQNKRSYSEGRSRKVSFDERLNTVHTYKKNNKKEIKNYEVSFQQLKGEKKKKCENVKQKRKEENFKKININDIGKRSRKRKSSLDEQQSISSN